MTIRKGHARTIRTKSGGTRKVTVKSSKSFAKPKRKK